MAKSLLSCLGKVQLTIFLNEVRIRVCLNFVFGVKTDEFFVLARLIFKLIAKAIDAKINEVSA